MGVKPCAMQDPVAITIETYSRIARGGVQPRSELQVDAARVEAFLLRTGRPLPRVVVLGGSLALRCMQVERCGGHATGVDASTEVIALARQLYPQGEFTSGDVRALPVDTNAFDGAWTESVFAHIPRKELAKALASVHRALRPGGLLYVRLPLGDTEGFEDTPHGQIFRVRWDQQQFELAVAALDFALLESASLPGNEAGLTFRREY